MDACQTHGGDRIERVRNGDAQALAEAFDAYRARLIRTARFRLDPRLLGRVDADDILQEAYVNASKRCTRVEGDNEHALFIWLRLIVLQTLADVHRRYFATRKRDVAREVPLHAGGGSAATTSLSMACCLLASITSPTRVVRRAEAMKRLEAALESMDEIDREVLALRHFEELANHEVAVVLGIEQKAASIRYVRALRRLKSIMSQTPEIDFTAIRGD